MRLYEFDFNKAAAKKKLAPGNIVPLADKDKNWGIDDYDREDMRIDLADIEYQIEDTQSLMVDYQKDLMKSEKALTKKGLSSDDISELKYEIRDIKSELSRYTRDLKNLHKEKEKIMKRMEASVPNEVQLKNIAAVLKRNCSQFIPIFKSAGALYRGVKLKGGIDKTPFLKGHSSLNRKPKDSTNTDQIIFDSLLAKLGFKALRSNSIFTISDRDVANNFGDVYAVFPINGFQFTWSPEFHDIVLHEVFNWYDFVETNHKLEQKKKSLAKWLSKTSKQFKNYEGVDEFCRGLMSLLDDIEVYEDNKELSRLLNSLGSNATYYYKSKIPKSFRDARTQNVLNVFIKTVESMKKDVSDDVKYDPEKFAKVYKPSNTNLAKAIKSSNEIYICGGYYLVKPDVAIMLKKYL